MSNRDRDTLAAVSKRLRSDPYAHFVGIQITRIERGYAEAELTVVDHMLNFNKVTHGGVIFSLADVAFAAACNSFNQTSVALSFHIVYRKPIKLGTKLVAEAKEESAGKNTALYKITVRTEQHRLVALCEGLAYKLESKVARIDNDGPEAI
ncbi:MAG: PaaI family thioesterase [Halobacteriota archaeon]